MLLQLVLTPVYLVAFIISLFVVDNQQRQWRLSQHVNSTGSSWLRYPFASSEPYQDVPGAKWMPHFSWKRRQIAKAEIGDVLEMSPRVIVVLVAWCVLGLLALAFAVRRVYFWIFAD